MSKTTIALLVGGLVVVVLVVVAFPKLASAYSKNAILTRCQELEARLAGARQQGGDPVEAARLEAELRVCYGNAEAAGVDLDLGQVTLDACKRYLVQTEAEWSHYRSTDYTDSVKRNNTRGTMLRLGEDMLVCLRQAVADAETARTMRAVKQFATEALAHWEMQRRCFLDDMSGCGRFGLSEPHGDDKAGDVGHRVADPLAELIRGPIAEKLASLDAAERAPSPTRFAAANPAASRSLLAGRVQS